MSDLIFTHNPDTCIGCGACQVACKDLHDLLPGEFFRRVISVQLHGQERFLSLACGHCENPACVEACPNGAFHRDDSGLILHNDSLCIGCGKCVWSCPLGAVTLSRTRGIAQKCDGCGGEPACVAACVNGSLEIAGADSVPLWSVLPVDSKPRIGLKAGGSHD